MLTNHREGGIRELWAISFPLMLSFLSGNLMQFVDLVVLARYSTEAMNAAAASGMIAMPFIYGLMAIAYIAEVFVGQYHGSKQAHRVAEPVWQMLWLSAMVIPVLLLIGSLGAPYLLGDYHYETMGRPHFQWMMTVGACFPAVAALSAFFIGLGRTRLVMTLSIIGNLMNVILDIVLIPRLGTAGAAIATGLSQVLQIVVLLFFFLPERQYGSRNWSFRPAMFWHYLRFGVPRSVSQMIELAAWALLARAMMNASAIHLTVLSLGYGFYSLLTFVEGLQKGVTAICSHFIVAKRWEMVTQSLRSGIVLVGILAAVVAIPLLFYPAPLIRLFAVPAELVGLARMTCVLIWLYLLFEGISWVASGVLTAAGDTTYLMGVNAAGSWLFTVVPAIIIVRLIDAPPTLPWILLNFYIVTNSFLLLRRIKNKRWQGIVVLR
jgi:multidrug resistance protein, MATE family